MKPDFDQILRDYPLPDVVAAAGIKLQKRGNELEGLCCFHGEKTPSFQLYYKGDRWRYHCKGCDAKGDVVQFVKDYYGCRDTMEAVRHLTGEAPRESVYTPSVLARDAYAGYVIGRPPENAPTIEAGRKTPPLLNPKRIDPETGLPKKIIYTPTAVYPYRGAKGNLIGYVLRVEFDDRKITPAIWWMKNEETGFEGWSHGSFQGPRPMYGAEEAHARPDAQILIVEGEKCKDAAKRIMEGRNVVPVTWMGGTGREGRTKWDALAGRSVIIWPDNDDVGREAAVNLSSILSKLGARVRIMRTEDLDKPKGWDIADAEREMTTAEIHAFIRERLNGAGSERTSDTRTDHAGMGNVPAMVSENDRADGPRKKPASLSAGAVDANAGGGERWNDGPKIKPGPKPEPPQQVVRGHGIDKSNWKQHIILNEDGGLKATSPQNAALIIEYEANFEGVFAWNEFAKETYVMRAPIWDPADEWTPRKITDNDVTECAMKLEFLKLSVKRNDMGAIIQAVAGRHPFNNVRDKLLSLQWDGHPRLSGGEYGLDLYAPWLTRYFGCEDSVINRAFGTKWMIGAVARALQPGCKVDSMLIIEGDQGIRKSSSIKALADAIAPNVFTDEISQIGSKDAGIDMQGVWIIEIAELDALGKAEVNAIKAWMTRQKDRFRRPYGKHAEEFPRTCVFAGTVNPLANVGYLKDATGGRRFWPVAAEYADIDAIRADAEQLWAEAVHLYQTGHEWWLDKAEEKLAGVAQDERFEVDPYGDIIDEYVKGLSSIHLNKLMEKALEIPKERMSPAISKRVTSHMARRGWRMDRDKGLFISPNALDGRVH